MLHLSTAKHFREFGTDDFCFHKYQLGRSFIHHWLREIDEDCDFAKPYLMICWLFSVAKRVLSQEWSNSYDVTMRLMWRTWEIHILHAFCVWAPVLGSAACSLRHNSVSCTFVVGFGSESHGPGQHAVEDFNIRAENYTEKGLYFPILPFACLLWFLSQSHVYRNDVSGECECSHKCRSN